MAPTRFAKLLIVCLGVIVFVTDARPVDTQESLKSSPFQRVLSGLQMGLELVWSLMPDLSTTTRPEDKTQMQVYVVGLGRTGTTSMASAMTMLGYKTLHDDEGASVADLYGQLYQGAITEDELHEQLGERGFNCSFMYSGYEWAGKNDDVKVILTTRDPEKWADSWLVVADGVDIMARRPFTWFKTVRDMMPLLEDVYKVIPTGGHPEGYLDRDTLIRGYSIHKDNVQKAVPADRLLVFNVKEGWAPLCQFLNVPVPDVPFPHINDRLKIRGAMMTLRVISWTWPLIFVVPVVLIWLIWRRVVSGKKVKTS